MQAAVFSFSVRGAELSKKIGKYLESIGYAVRLQTVSKYAAAVGLEEMLPNHNEACKAAFKDCQTIVFVGATGIAVRTIAPYLISKVADPAVVSVDERGNFVIPLVSGHIGGANELSRCLAAYLGGVACVTTATDVNGLFAVDEWAARSHMSICSMKAAKDFAAALVDKQKVGLYLDDAFTVEGALPVNVERNLSLPIGMAITLDSELSPFPSTVRLLPRIVHLGIGCRRNTPLESIEALALPALNKLRIDLRSIAGIASVDLKKDEQGLLAFAAKYKLPANFYTAEELNEVEGDFTPSAFVQSVVGVSNVCERSAVKDSNGGRLLLQKTSLNGVTLAIAAEALVLDFSKTGLKRN